MAEEQYETKGCGKGDWQEEREKSYLMSINYLHTYCM